MKKKRICRKCLNVEYRIEYNFQKFRVTGPWDHKVPVSAKIIIKKKFHASVHLIKEEKRLKMMYGCWNLVYLGNWV
jgi:hypothetical protein